MNQSSRDRLDPFIDSLASAIGEVLGDDEPGNPASFAGLLNYCCTRLTLRVVPEQRYWVIATVTGVFQNIISEFYRRYAVPYEEQQIENNGDVY